MGSETNELINLLTKKSQECDKLEETLGVIILNTLHRDFNGDIMYKSGVLGNIKEALGEEKYNHYVELYS